MSAELLVMAAGMGSRFGGLKQAAPIGPNGEIIVDYSVYDAVKAGFDKVVFIIRKDFEKEFREACGKRIEKMVDTHYVFQEKDYLPEGFTLPEGRLKPWGTGHAVLCAKDAIKNPFLVINADDYYGSTIYKDMYDHLTTSKEMAMAGYKLKNTLSENGSVTRGLCSVKDGYLTDIKETHDISKDSGYDGDTVASMNMWGLGTDIFEYLDKQFNEFLKANINEPKKEFLLPEIIGTLMPEKKVKVIPTSEQWYGVTYAEDAPYVKAAISELVKRGLYD